MQLMLEDLELRYKVLSDAQMIQGCAAIEGTIEYAKSLVIKEKEQMFYWFYGGGGLSATDDFREEFEKNYNQTYNQNK